MWPNEQKVLSFPFRLLSVLTFYIPVVNELSLLD